MLLVWGCKPRPVLSPNSDLRVKIRDLALHLVGLPYKLSGAEIDGFDCSGFVWYLYSCHGIDLPRTAREQKDGLKRLRIHLERARPADILVFHIDGGWHTGIWVEPDRFVHAPRQGRTVSVEPLNEYWRRRLRLVISLLPD